MSRRFFKTITATGSLAMLLGLSACSFNSLLEPATSAVEGQAEVVPNAVSREYRSVLAELDKGADGNAEAQLRVFIERHPEYANAYVNLAILSNQRGDAATALQWLQQALAIDPDNVYAQNHLGLIKRQQGDFAAAEQVWLTLTEQQPDYANAWYNLGVLYDLYLQDLVAALDHYQRYQELTEGSAPDASVQRWIADLERRVGATQKTANSMEGM